MSERESKRGSDGKFATKPAPAMSELRLLFAARWISEPNSGCWLWTGSIARCGYGVLSIHGRPVYAHRLSWQIRTGLEIPAHHEICHHCDTRPCVNPDHLFLGTRSDNMKDMARKGRMNFQRRGWCRGEACGKRLDEQTVIAIRATPGNSIELAARFGTTISHIQRIKRQESWSHLATPLVPLAGISAESVRRGAAINTAKLTEADVLAIRASAESTKGLARRYGVRAETIRNVRKGVTWKHIGAPPPPIFSKPDAQNA